MNLGGKTSVPVYPGVRTGARPVPFRPLTQASSHKVNRVVKMTKDGV